MPSSSSNAILARVKLSRKLFTFDEGPYAHEVSSMLEVFISKNIISMNVLRKDLHCPNSLWILPNYQIGSSKGEYKTSTCFSNEQGS